MRPRQVIPGRSYMFTRRCSERRFFLRPDRQTTNAFWYCLGWAAQKYGLALHAAVAMSNHVHVAASDPQGVYPDFLRDFLGLLARCVNTWRGRWEHFWDANQASAVALEDASAQLDKLIYVLANPVGLVERADQWPGATALQSVLSGKPVVATRPRHFFRDDKAGGAMPETVAVTFVPPPGLECLSRQEYARLVREGVAQVEAQSAAARRSRGTGVLGRKRILAERWDAKPVDAEPRRGLSPTVACRDKWRRIERLLQNKWFQTLYRQALAAFRRGLVAVFPAGTWAMRFRAPIEVSTA